MNCVENIKMNYQAVKNFLTEEKKKNYLRIKTMKRNLYFYLIIIFSIIGGYHIAFADTICMKNGSVFKGKIISMDKNTVTIELFEGYEITVNRDDALQISTKDISCDEFIPDSLSNSMKNLRKKGYASCGLKIGYFFPSDKSFSDIYGSGFTLGIDMKAWTESGLGFAAGFEYFRKTKKLTSTSVSSDNLTSLKCSVLPITVSIMYCNTKKEVNSYLGFGGGIYLFKEVGYSGLSNVFSDAKEVVGYHILGGIESRISSNSFLLLELKYSNAKFDVENEKINIGGFTILAGLRFSD